MAAASDTRLGNRRLAVGVESVEAEVGGGCFRGLVQTLAETPGVAYAFLAEPPYLYADRARLQRWRKPSPGGTPARVAAKL